MTTFLLIVLISQGGAVTAEFKDKAQCEVALDSLKRQVRNYYSFYGGCYEKSN